MYQLVLFAHIVGALSLFAAMALEWVSLLRLRRATTVGQAREWINLAASLSRVYALSMLALLLSGIYMTVVAWAASGMAAIGWIGVSFVAMIALAVIGAGLTRRPTTAMLNAVDAERDEHGPISATLGRRLRDPLVWASAQTRAGIALGIVFAMTVKPDAVGSVLAVAVGAALGFATSLPALGRGRAAMIEARRLHQP